MASIAAAAATQSNAEAVREFTAGAGQPTPNQPSAMTEGEVGKYDRHFSKRQRWRCPAFWRASF